jgi:mRNA interferase MazF
MSFSPGDVVLIPLSQFAGGPPKLRPALLLASLPGPYQTQLVCGISTQLHQRVSDWDELIQPSDADFASSGLHRASIIRLSYIHATDPTELAGAIGQIDAVRLDRLLARLAVHLHP